MSASKLQVQRLALVALWAAVAVLAARRAIFVAEAATHPSPGFICLYTAARVLADGEDGARLYDDRWFQEEEGRHQAEPDFRDIYAANPPTTAWLAMPLAALDYPAARKVWILASVAFLAAATVLLVRALDLRGPRIPAALALVLLFQPVWAGFHYGHVYAFLLLLLTAAWLAYRRRGDTALGALLGLLLAFKLTGALIWPVLLVQRRWRALIVATATALAIALVSLPWVGLGAWRAWAGGLGDLNARWDVAVTAFQSLPGFTRHLFTATPWNAGPLVDAPVVGQALLALAAIALLAGTLRSAVDSTEPAFAAAILAGLVLVPVTQDYTYTLALVPIAVAIGLCRERGSTPLWIALGVAVFLIGKALPYRSPALAAGALSLLAYPKLYGALALWTLTVRERAK